MKKKAQLFLILALAAWNSKAQDKMSYGVVFEPHMKSYGNINEDNQIFNYESNFNFAIGFSGLCKLSDNFGIHLDIMYSVNTIKERQVDRFNFQPNFDEDKSLNYDYLEIPIGIVSKMFSISDWKFSISSKFVNSFYLGFLNTEDQRSYSDSGSFFTIQPISYKGYYSRLITGIDISNNLNNSLTIHLNPHIAFYTNDIHSKTRLSENPILFGLTVKLMKASNNR